MEPHAKKIVDQIILKNANPRLQEKREVLPEHYDTRFEDFGQDSLEIVEMIIELEREFNIAIPDSLAEKANTPAKLYALLDQIMKDV